MLRAGRFVNLYRVVRGGLRTGVESYSIKQLEQFFAFTRQVSLSEANSALFAMSRLLEFGDGDAIHDAHKEAIAGYNRDDCASARHLRRWLEDIRRQLVSEGAVIERPVQGDGQPSEEISERQQMIQALAERIAGDVDPLGTDLDPEGYGRWVLANVLDWHRREEKATWWEYFRLSDLSVDELTDERAALSGLEFIGEVDAAGRTPVHRYRFPVQETNLRGNQGLRAAGGDDLGTLVSIDAENFTVDIKKRRNTADVHPSAVFAYDLVAGPNLVLVGDPQQLDQPTQGTHPEGTEVSALGHLLGDRPTITGEQGLFLEETWRLHPDICAFTSEAFYEDKLEVRPGLDSQRVYRPDPSREPDCGSFRYHTAAIRVRRRKRLRR